MEKNKKGRLAQPDAPFLCLGLLACFAVLPAEKPIEVVA